MLSGPVALWGLMSLSIVRTFNVDLYGRQAGCLAWSKVFLGVDRAELITHDIGLVETVKKKVRPPFFKGATPVLSFLRGFMKFQKCFEFLLSFVNMSLCNSHVSHGRSLVSIFRVLYLSQSLGCLVLLARLNQRFFMRVIHHTCLVIQGCVNRCWVVRDGTLSSIIF